MKSQKDLPSTIGITKQVHTADTIEIDSSIDNASSQDSQGSASKDTVGTSTTSTAEFSIAVSYKHQTNIDDLYHGNHESRITARPAGSLRTTAM